MVLMLSTYLLAFILYAGLILVRLSRLFHATTCAVFWVLMFSNWVFAFSNWVFEVFFKIFIRVFCSFMKTQALFLNVSPYFGEFQLDHQGSLTGVKFALAIYRNFSISPLSFSIFKLSFWVFKLSFDIFSKLSFCQNALK